MERTRAAQTTIKRIIRIAFSKVPHDKDRGVEFPS